MKTSKKVTFPKLESEYLENILRQLLQQYNIIQMFFTREPSSAISHLIIHIENSIDANKLQENKWVRRVKKRCQINVNFIYSSKLQHRFALGYPFIEFYCRPSAVIYQNKDLDNHIDITRNWKKYKKRFNLLLDQFYHDHDLYLSQIQNLISEGSSNSIFTSYARLIEYDLDYLEELYAGNKSTAISLDDRITNLTEYTAVIQKYFVRNKHNKYYLIDLFVKAKEAIDNDEAIYHNEMYESVAIAQHGLCRLIEKRFDELKKLIKKGSYQRNEIACQINDNPKDAVVSIAIDTILESVEVEEIYLYHQITYGEKTTYYLMLIAIGAGNEKLKLITKSLKSKTGEEYDFVLLSHCRYWIQANLYQHQSFFCNIVQDKYLIYSSSRYLPEFHWEMPHNPYHADLFFYYKPTKDIALQFFAIASNDKENYQGLEYFFALFFMSFCRTYIFVKTYYLPNYLSSKALWNLCIYADEDVRKYNYLIEHFWINFFPYVDRNMNLHHNLSKLNKEQALQMSVIVDKLMNELQNLVIENGLIISMEQG